ncbi:hypothetical protein KSC_090100 [Ktedonobacter sp. SOSP1-52]|uniref:hypothetical protein n=1 Tax=Ktedonobacter sp. SOSP1-52 TaxID=2778366 RepID=UPI0019163F03|nr:hypothetical protein [Ktedonobacter sp. SOSP1-52]GHO70118.1 hypothetical protein KSC_090100 [Ktedonobacter sp. SOSP1-52]
MRVSRRRFLAGSVAMAGALGMLPEAIGQHAIYAASAPIGQTIWLQATNNNNFVSARNNQTNTPLQATSTQVQTWEEFDVVDAGNGLIALRSHANNNYVSARISQTNVPLQATATQVQGWEQFNWLPQSNGTIALQSAANNNYVSARTDQTNTPLQATATQVQAWEQFNWGLATPPIGKTIWLQATNNNNYVSAHNDQTNAPLQATATQVQGWEQFDVVDAGNGLIALLSHANNNYVSAHISQTNAPLQATATQVQAWEQFNWVLQNNGTVALQSAANNNYVSARTDQTNTPLDATSTQAQAWEQFRWGQVGGSGGSPNFGPNVYIFDPTMSSSTIQNTLTSVFNQQQSNQFGSNRYAFLFKPGTYNVDVNLGFYTQVLGLGYLPGNVTINGAVHVAADWMPDHNATCNFWRAAENMTVIPPTGTNIWAVSQAAPFRRMNVQGNMKLDDGGWSSGGFLADTHVSGQVNSGTQQQWLSRNDQLGSWTGYNWNMVFVGVNGAPGQSFPNPPYTVVGQVPVIREKPFLYIDQSGNYQVFVPALRTNSQGTSWGSGSPAGTSIPLSQFYIAQPSDTATTLNNALAQGLNLLFTPGIYSLNGTINVTRANTVVLGLGLATLVPQNGVIPMTVADVDGVTIAGLLFDAGPVNSPVLLQIGPSGSSQSHAANPTLLSDVFIRIGGTATAGLATQSLVINSNDVILDDLWIWRADHGINNNATVGWTVNPAANGLIVNGNNVTAYGLFVEHYQQYQVIWNGNGGRTYFFQNELPYDPPTQSAWMNGSTNGYAAYKVANSVTSHEAWGLGSYCYFNVNPSVVEDHSFEVPNTPGVKFHDMVTVSLGGTGTIAHIINSTGGPSNSSNSVAKLVSYP